MDTFVFKLLVTPLLIGGVSLAGRRWGPAVSGWLVGLPLTSGPVALFLALDQGPAFAAATARGILLGLVSIAVFCLVYAWVSLRFAWGPALAIGWLSFLASTATLQGLILPVEQGLVLVVGALAASLWLLPPARRAPAPLPAPGWEIPVRMLVATAFVLALTGSAQLLGPHLSGLLAPFPIFTSILAAFTHRFQGAAAAGPLLRGVLLGSFSFVGFFVAVATLLLPLGILPAFATAVVTALVLHGVALWLLHRRHVPAAEVPPDVPGPG